MRSTRTLWLPALSVAAALTLASRGGSGGQSTEETISVGAGSGSTNMDAGASRQAVAPNGEYSDAAFVDAMIPHHEGALEMAESLRITRSTRRYGRWHGRSSRHSGWRSRSSVG